MIINRSVRFVLRLALVPAMACVACGGSKAASSTPSATTTAASGGETGARQAATPERMALARTHAKTIASAAVTWIGAHPEGVCPDIATLKADRTLDAMADEKDAWGHPFAVSCTETEVTVSSHGADGAGASADDVVEKGTVAAPPASTGPAARTDVPFKTNDAGAFSKGAVAALVEQKIGACKAKVNDPAAGGVLALKIVVRSDGTVKSVNALRAKTQMKSAVTVACVLKELARSQLGATGSNDDQSFELP